jgi:DNA modification methylase
VFNGKVLFSGSVRRHPNEKPVAWLEPFIKRSCPVGGIVLDPFMGSGSTGVACLNTKRDFIGIEIDEKFFGEANKRLVGHLKTLQSLTPEILEIKHRLVI